jgi:uncharacterized repeat protein (TIGR03843 family)
MSGGAAGRPTGTRSPGDAARRLLAAPLELIGRFADASNATLLVRLTDRDPRPIAELAGDLGREPSIDDLDPVDLAVYKPRRGEAPLWDFPTGTLHRREVAAFEVAAEMGWDLVPTTVLREDGPVGVGSLQRYADHDPALHYFALLESGEPGLLDQLRRMVVFDLVIDNADRKGGHVLLEVSDRADAVGGGGRIRAVDHGVSFNVVPKLRTVAWDFAGEPVPAPLLAAVRRLRDALDHGFGDRVVELLSGPELEVMRERVDRVAAIGEFPEPHGPVAYPWPLL